MTDGRLMHLVPLDLGEAQVVNGGCDWVCPVFKALGNAVEAMMDSMENHHRIQRSSAPGESSRSPL